MQDSCRRRQKEEYYEVCGAFETGNQQQSGRFRLCKEAMAADFKGYEELRKYRALGLSYGFSGTEPLSGERILEIKTVFERDFSVTVENM